MAVLTDTARREEWTKFMSDLSGLHEPLATDKTTLRQAFNDLDDFFNTNAPAINNAISLPARNELTTPQKALIAARVITRRWVEGA